MIDANQTTDIKVNLSLPWSGKVRVASIVRYKEQPRTHFNKDELIKLGESMRRKQITPCEVVPCTVEGKPAIQWMLIDGERRWRAAQMAGLEFLKVSYDPEKSLAEAHADSLTANFCRAGHTKMEIAKAIQVELGMGKSMTDISDMLGRGETFVSNHLALLGLHPDLQKLLDEPTPRRDRIALTTAVMLTKYPLDRQCGIWTSARTKSKGDKSVAEFMVRTSSEASLRKGGEEADARYLAGQLKTARSIVGKVLIAPDALLNRLPADLVADALLVVEQLRGEALKVRSRLEAVVERRAQ